ncbi:hypothetical protein ABIA33_001231 [Streptacidiphilus sp. MAP12-16]|uniref:hypothetical protein n=1 Tax=Streptacidiphilus sp. MAP12-16 TaxID=3156300 RepID=UPI0035178E03
MKTAKIEFEVTQEDVDAARLVGASGSEVIERSIHAQLDAQGVPREGREVHVTRETIEIELPAGWRVAS